MGLFFFLAAGGVALFAFLSAAHWVSARAAERQAVERLALLRKLADPPESAGIVLAQLREDDARRERKDRLKADRASRDACQGGLVVFALGVGLAIFLKAIAPDQAVWTIGIIPMLTGAVFVTFTFFRTLDAPRVDDVSRER